MPTEPRHSSSLAGFPYHAIDTYLPKPGPSGRTRGDLRTPRGSQTGQRAGQAGRHRAWLRRAWCWEIIFWPTRKIPIWRRSISAGKIPAWLFSIFQPANFMPPRAAMLTSTNSFPTWRRRKSSTSADTKTASPMRSAAGTIPIGSMSGSFGVGQPGQGSASSSALSRSRALVSNSSAAAFRRQGPFSTTSNLPNIRIRPIFRPFRVSTRRITFGSINSRSATWRTTTLRTVRARSARSQTWSIAPSRRWAGVCSSGGSPCRSRRLIASTNVWMSCSGFTTSPIWPKASPSRFRRSATWSASLRA